MPAEKLDPGENADILAFREIIKEGDFSRLGPGSMIIFIERACETAAVPPVAFLPRSAKRWPRSRQAGYYRLCVEG
jgi:hypothetical protein